MNGFLVILAGVSILFTAVGQLLLKIGANAPNVYKWIPPLLKPYINRYTIPGYGMLFVVTIFSIYILEDMPLKYLFPIFISANLIAIAFLSHLILHESFSYSKFLGICLIVSGIFVFSL